MSIEFISIQNLVFEAKSLPYYYFCSPRQHFCSPIALCEERNYILLNNRKLNIRKNLLNIPLSNLTLLNYMVIKKYIYDSHLFLYIRNL